MVWVSVPWCFPVCDFHVGKSNAIYQTTVYLTFLTSWNERKLTNFGLLGMLQVATIGEAFRAGPFEREIRALGGESTVFEAYGLDQHKGNLQVSWVEGLRAKCSMQLPSHPVQKWVLFLLGVVGWSRLTIHRRTLLLQWSVHWKYQQVGVWGQLSRVVVSCCTSKKEVNCLVETCAWPYVQAEVVSLDLKL